MNALIVRSLSPKYLNVTSSLRLPVICSTRLICTQSSFSPWSLHTSGCALSSKSFSHLLPSRSIHSTPTYLSKKATNSTAAETCDDFDSLSRPQVDTTSSLNQSDKKESTTHNTPSFLGKLYPYYRLARLDKPIGTMLLLWPCYWSISLAAPMSSFPDFKMMFLFSAGALIMRGAGCTINDFWDRDIDGKVERTKTRPIASGEVSPTNALVFFAGQSLAGLGVLVQLPPSAIVLGACSMPLVIAYPLAKRYFPMPQLVLGSAFNWGALLGGAAVASDGMPPWEWALPLYGGAICWTLVYDTLYAHQDKVNDAELGLYSSALTLGNENTKPFLAGCSALTVGGIALAGYTADLNWPFYVATSLGAAQLAWQVQDAKLDDPADLWQKFTSNNSFGAIITLGIIAGHF